MSAAPEAAADATSARILDVAERLVQVRGFNGFSYADIALKVGITKASLHYHFPTKAELGRRLVIRYTDAFAAALTRISAGSGDPRQRLSAYVRLYSDVLAGRRMCLCGMVAAEYATLPQPMQTAIRRFFELNESWVAAQIAREAPTGGVATPVTPREAARALVGALEGGMLVARVYGDPARFDTAARLLLRRLAGARPAAVRRRESQPAHRLKSVLRAARRRG
jgi:TetR/AcrR family transcriptional regulator, transcriptional repressor for nem operon